MAKKILGTALGLATGGVVGAAAGLGSSLLGGKKKKASAAPVTEAPRVMPTADDEAVRRAKRNSLMQQMGRGGRTSTILSTDSDSLGG